MIVMISYPSNAQECKVKLKVNSISMESESGIFLFIPFTPIHWGVKKYFWWLKQPNHLICRALVVN